MHTYSHVPCTQHTPHHTYRHTHANTLMKPPTRIFTKVLLIALKIISSWFVFFKGIVGLDLALQALKDSVADFTILDNGYGFVISRDGNVVSKTRPLKNHRFYFSDGDFEFWRAVRNAIARRPHPPLTRVACSCFVGATAGQWSKFTEQLSGGIRKTVRLITNSNVRWFFLLCLVSKHPLGFESTPCRVSNVQKGGAWC